MQKQMSLGTWELGVGEGIWQPVEPRSSWFQILVSKFTHCVTLGKSLPVSEPGFLQLKCAWQSLVGGGISLAHLNLCDFTART